MRPSLALVKSHSPSSTRLINHIKWLEFENGETLTATCKVTLKQQPYDWNSFILRIEMCDWLFHCQDVIVTKIEKTNDKERIINFKFISKEDLAIYKLNIYVEYFLPDYLHEDEDKYELEFEISLADMNKLKNYFSTNKNKVQVHNDSATCSNDEVKRFQLTSHVV